MKKIAFLLCALLLSTTLFAYDLPEDFKQVQEYTLENGMEVFLLEDFSTPLVKVDFSVKAGFSNQTPQTCGFFKLYSRILQHSFSSSFFDDVQCNSDSTRYIFTAAPSTLEASLSRFSDCIFSTQFDDQLLSTQLTALKQEVTDSSASAAGMINAAIDSRVFSSAPWKHDSGVYPALFNRNTEKTARATLKDIGEIYYTPQNSAIFISGNINSGQLLNLLRNLFGKYYSSRNQTEEAPSTNQNSQRKFVLHDAEFSTELTQVVVQYTLLDMEQSDLLAAALENNYSSFKQKLLSISDLNIPGYEYINAASAHKRDNSRLIFQTLMQPPENKKIKTSSLQQAEEFVQNVKQIPETLQSLEVISAENQLQNKIREMCNSSAEFMENLSQFWAIKGFEKLTRQDYSDEQLQSVTAAEMLDHFVKINQTEISDLKQVFVEDPYVFVIVSDDDFKKNKKAYAAAGYEEINSKNASWYVQEMYKNQRDQFKPEESNSWFYAEKDTKDNSYAERNLAQIKSFTLNNGITVTSKQNNATTGVSVLLNIAGGRLNSADDNGFEEVMISILSSMIQKELYNEQASGIILGRTSVSTNFQNYTSSILIECDSDDFTAVCSAAAKALIYGEIMPAAADRAVNARQYRKRLENGSAVNQMYAAAIKSLFPDTAFTKIYEAQNEILQTTDYAKILAAYPSLLEADRFSLIITGNFKSEELQLLERGFGQLESNSNQKLYDKIPVKLPEDKSINVKIVHTFLTDIPAEKAGPQPSVLIPTTEFLDPVLYFIKAPALEDAEVNKNENALFNALLNYFGMVFQNQIADNKRIAEAKVEIRLPETNIPLGQITVQNVAHTKELDSTYKAALQNLTQQLSSVQSQQILQQIKNYWTETQLNQAATNSGTASLMQKGYEQYPDSYDPAFYLKEYSCIQNATLEDFQKILSTFPSRPNYRFYSSDSKN